MEGFFARSSLDMVRAPTARQPQCGRCGLLSGCNTPKMPVGGRGKRKIMIIGEAPGGTEDQSGVQFVGDAGNELAKFLRLAGIELHTDCWTHNALSCRPPNNKIDNDNKIEYCRPLVIQAIEKYKPRVIILVGMSAMKSVIGHIWKDKIGDTKRWVGWHIPCQKWNCWICPTWHPSYIMRLNRDPLADRDFREHLAWACKQKERPFPDGVPDYESQVEPIISSREAAIAIKDFNKSKAITFDYETTTLKPVFPKSEIVCCSISDGKRTIAFPWHGKAIEAMRKLLLNPNVIKDGWNTKFEQEWSLLKLGIRIRGMRWCGMVGAHMQDVRSGITGVEFQEFVQLGITDHKATIKEYLSSEDKGSTKCNRIKEIPIADLLLYNGLDSLVEYLLDQKQMKELKYAQA